MDIHVKSLDMDMDVNMKLYIHDKLGFCTDRDTDNSCGANDINSKQIDS